MNNFLITICARGGSKGIPKKNIKDLANKPLIAYTIEHANQFRTWLESTHGYKVFIELSTDDEEIKRVANEYELRTDYTRPDYLANDKAGKLDAIKDILLFKEEANKLKFDYILDLDVSAPMRNLNDLIEGYDIFIKDSDASTLFSVSPANKNPYFNMVEQNKHGYWELSKKVEGFVLSRQTAPQVKEMNASFYFYRRTFYDNERLYLFNKALVYTMIHESFDLDHIIDFEFLNYLISQNKLSFNL